jgi:hypothetical protein
VVRSVQLSGALIDRLKVVVDVSGTPYVDYEMQVRARMALD